MMLACQPLRLSGVTNAISLVSVVAPISILDRDSLCCPSRPQNIVRESHPYGIVAQMAKVASANRGAHRACEGSLTWLFQNIDLGHDIISYI